MSEELEYFICERMSSDLDMRSRFFVLNYEMTLFISFISFIFIHL